MLSGEIVSRLRRIQRGKCHPQSVKTCEQSREIQNSCDFDEQRHVQKVLESSRIRIFGTECCMRFEL